MPRASSRLHAPLVPRGCDVPRYRLFSKTENVLDAALRRLRHIYETFDHVIVAYTGGKDSHTVLHLARMVASEFGIDRVDVSFRDREIVQDVILDFVDETRQLPWVDMRWYCLPGHDTCFILGETRDYIFWQPGVEWFRPMPPFAVTAEGVYSFQEGDEFVARPFRGKVCILSGLRAEESLQRYRAVVNKLNEPHIASTGTRSRISIGRPIYDWVEADVFKFLSDGEIPYCRIYDAQLLTGEPLRTSVPVASEAAVHIHRMAAQDPRFLERLQRRFPGVDMHARYSREYDKGVVIAQYAVHGIDGARRWIEDKLQGQAKADALAAYEAVRRLAANCPSGYAPERVLRSFVTGGWKRGSFLPLTGNTKETSK